MVLAALRREAVPAEVRDVEAAVTTTTVAGDDYPAVVILVVLPAKSKAAAEHMAADGKRAVVGPPHVLGAHFPVATIFDVPSGVTINPTSQKTGSCVPSSSFY